MISKVFNLIGKEYSGEIAKQVVSHVISFHRIQASPGYRAAAEYMGNLLSEAGLSFEVLKYPAKEGETFWNYSSFQESFVSKAKLFLISKSGEEKIADYSEVKMSLIQRSSSTPKDGTISDLIILEKGDTEKEYRKVDVEGKVVLASGDITLVYNLAVEKYGAIGIISDRMTEWPPVREKIDLPDGLLYTSFWWHPQMIKCFGFVVSPRIGTKIRAQAKKEKLKVRALVESKIYDGTIEVVSATIPGDTKQEVVMTAHLCHPQPSANDNASGVGALIESARTLNELIKQGKLSRPKRTIRFLLIPEMTGTFAFFSRNEDKLRNFVAGINLDMVGEDQKTCGSILMVDSTPLSFPTFVNAYIKHIFEFLPKDIKTLPDSKNLSSLRYAFIKFSGGSDHEILSDPSVNIPTPSFTNWPDKYYHTSEDTIDKVSPQTLWKVGTIASTFAYTMANFTEANFSLLATLTEEYCEEKVKETFDKIILKLSNSDTTDFRKNASGQLRNWIEEKNFWRLWLGKAIEDLTRIDNKSEEPERLALLYCSELNKYIRLKDSLLKEYVSTLYNKFGVTKVHPKIFKMNKLERETAMIIPSRLQPGPIDIKSRAYVLEKEDHKKVIQLQRRSQWRLICYTAISWIDGKRSIYDIIRMMRLELEYNNIEELVELFRLFEKMGFVSLKRTNK